MKKDILEKIEKMYLSEEVSDDRKLDLIYEMVLEGLGKKENTPSNNELLKLGKSIIKKKKLSITKLKLNKEGMFEFVVYYSDGCNGDWWDKEVLTPYMFFQKIIKPNLK